MRALDAIATPKGYREQYRTRNGSEFCVRFEGRRREGVWGVTDAGTLMLQVWIPIEYSIEGYSRPVSEDGARKLFLEIFGIEPVGTYTTRGQTFAVGRPEDLPAPG
jgi:hypothetical protein